MTGLGPKPKTSLQPWRDQTQKLVPEKKGLDPTMKDGGDGDTGKRPQGDRTNKVPSMSCPYNHGYSLMAYFPI